MKFKNIKLVDPISGQPVTIGDEEMTVCTALCHALMIPPADPEKKPYTGEQKAERYDECVRLRKVLPEQDFDLSAEMYVMLKEDVNRLFNTAVAGQLWSLMREKH